MFGYIYKTTNLINNKIYIGKKHSKVFLTDYFGSGLLINRAIKKYGLDKFQVELICFANSLEELNSKEKYYISTFNSHFKSGKGYNIAGGGDGGNIISMLSKEAYNNFIIKCRINNSGVNNPNYGNGDKIRGDKNPAKRADVREKISEKLSGPNNPMYGKKQTKEQIQNRITKTKERNNGKFPNQFTKNPNAKHWRDKTYYIYEEDNLIKIFKNKISLKKYCIEELNFSNGMIEKCLKENIKIGDLVLYKGSITYSKNLEAQLKYKNYYFKTDNTEIS